MIVLLSIKPEFAYKIFNGTKGYEFRKNIFKRKDVSKIIVYASSPVRCIIGEFEISAILYDDVEQLWEETKHWAGISEETYNQYFENKKKAFAIKIGPTTLYPTPISLSEINVNRAPQSFCYLISSNNLFQNSLQH